MARNANDGEVKHNSALSERGGDGWMRRKGWPLGNQLGVYERDAAKIATMTRMGQLRTDLFRGRDPAAPRASADLFTMARRLRACAWAWRANRLCRFLLGGVRGAWRCD